ncbi:MAG: hypothetical protein KAR42_11860 [candidate division Zixibacteria bacterium]|nr:hypothetical protein [candidate division Zixibacteria bacterium]
MAKEVLGSLNSAKQDLTESLSELEREADIVRADIASLDRIIQRYQNPTSPNGAGDYSGKTLREAIGDILNKSYPKVMRVSAIKKKLLDGGYQTKSDNFESAIFGMISQMIKIGDIEKIDKGQYKALKNQIVSK